MAIQTFTTIAEKAIQLLEFMRDRHTEGSTQATLQCPSQDVANSALTIFTHIANFDDKKAVTFSILSPDESPDATGQWKLAATAQTPEALSEYLNNAHTRIRENGTQINGTFSGYNSQVALDSLISANQGTQRSA